MKVLRIMDEAQLKALSYKEVKKRFNEKIDIFLTYLFQKKTKLAIDELENIIQFFQETKQLFQQKYEDEKIKNKSNEEVKK